MGDNTITPFSATHTLTPREAVDMNPITPLAQRSMFWRPSYLDQSAWLEHIPFAFWLVEAHHPRLLVELGAQHGVAYFAFCQSISRLGLNTRCFAVDTWKDNDGAFEKLSVHNDAQYSGFSRLVRSTFDDARENFTDGSIDLLHMEEPKSYDTMKRHFDAWFPKLSPAAVVVLHGTNIRERQSGSFRFFDEMKERYPWFEFSHGLGLGVVGVGKEQNKIVSRLFEMRDVDSSAQVIREVFSRLGRACSDSLDSITHQNRANELTRLVENQKQLCDELKISLMETKTDLDSRKREAAEIKAKLQNQIEHHATERGQLNERVTLLQETRLELKEEVARLQAKLDTAFVRLAEKGQELTRLAIESADCQRQIESYGEQIKNRDGKLAEKDQALNSAKAKVDQLNQALAQKEQEAKAETERLRHVQAEQQALAQQLAEREAQVQAQSVTAAALEQQLAQVSGELATALHEATVQRERAARLETANQTLQAEQQALAQQLAEREAQVQAQTVTAAALEQQLVHVKGELATALHEATVQRERAARLETANQTLQAEQQALGQRLAEREAQVQTQSVEAAALEQRLAQVAGELAAAMQEVTAQSERVASLEAANRTLQAEQKENAQQLEARLKELTLLTQQIGEREAQVQAQTVEAAAREQKLEAMTGELAAAARDVAAQRERLVALEAANREVQAERQALVVKLDERFKELAKLTQLLMERDAQAQTQALEAAAREQRLAQVAEELAAAKRVAAAESERAATLDSANRLLQDEQQVAAKKLEDRFMELAMLTKILVARDRALMEKNQQIEIERQRTTRLKESFSWRITAPARALGRKLKKKKAGAGPTKAQVSLIEQSGLFDADWYIEQYPDVSAMDMEPIEHYVRYGAVEGRDPGPGFNTTWYVNAYKDVAMQGENPLVHFIKFGKQEGREPMPKQEA